MNISKDSLTERGYLNYVRYLMSMEAGFAFIDNHLDCMENPDEDELEALRDAHSIILRMIYEVEL